MIQIFFLRSNISQMRGNDGGKGSRNVNRRKVIKLKGVSRAICSEREGIHRDAV